MDLEQINEIFYQEESSSKPSHKLPPLKTEQAEAQRQLRESQIQLINRQAMKDFAVREHLDSLVKAMACHKKTHQNKVNIPELSIINYKSITANSFVANETNSESYQLRLAADHD